MQAAHIRQNVQHRVATPLDVNLIQAHVDQHALHQILFKLARLQARLQQPKHARILQLGQLIQVEGQVLQRELRLVDLVQFSALPRAELNHLHRAFLVNGVAPVLLEVEADLICHHVDCLLCKMVPDLLIRLAVVVASALDNVDQDALSVGRICGAPNLQIRQIRTGIQMLELL